MGRRPFMTMLALGRSPCEAPERAAVERPAEFPVDTNADGYVQEFDDRGHPINRQAKLQAKQLRKAKNDVLSTMGIVVAGDDGGSNGRAEQDTIKALSEENDYGLIIATTDQIAMFVTSWWSFSLASRIQTFKRYSNVPLAKIISVEFQKAGFFGFFGSGFPLWSISFMMSNFRNHFLGSGLRYLYYKLSPLSDAEWYQNSLWGSFRVLSIGITSLLYIVVCQTYMFALLQSLHILPVFSIPPLRFFNPFTPGSLMRIPYLPIEKSLFSLGISGFKMLTSPFALLLLYVNLRPVIDARIYRLLRRHLPKPDRPDKLSLRVALESDLIDWTIPTLGKRSEEEIRRSNMTLTEDIVHELITVKNWVLSFFMPRPASDQEKSAGSDGYIQKRIEQLRLDLGLVQRPGNTEAAHDSRPVHTREETHIYPQPEAGPSGTAIPHQPRRGDEMEPNQILVDEEHRFAQSPLQIQEEYFSSVHPAAGAAAEPIEVLPGELSAARDLRSSRSNTLYSRSPSPASSPPTSPRVRASLIHQNSDVITMHLELLQSHSDRNSQPLTITPNILQQNEAQANSIDRTASDILDALLSSRRLSRDEARVQPVQQAQNIPAQAMPAPTIPAPAPTIPAPAPTIPAPAPTIPDRRPLSEILSSSEMATLAAAVNGAFVGPGEAVTGSPLRIQAPPLPPLLQPPQPPPPPQPPQAPIDSPASTLSHLHRQPFPARPKQPKNDESDHRITLLSSHPTDAFSFHLSSIITSILFYPLESFYLRHLAMTTLSSRSMLTILPIGITATTLGLRGDVRNPGAWFGGGTVSGMATYIGKMLLIVGCEAVVSAGAWGVGVGAAVLFGRRKFNWGYL